MVILFLEPYNDKGVYEELTVYLFFYLFIQYFKRVAHLAVQLFYLAALCANIFYKYTNTIIIHENKNIIRNSSKYQS